QSAAVLIEQASDVENKTNVCLNEDKERGEACTKFIHSSLPHLKGSFTVDDAIDSCGFGKFQWIIAAVFALSLVASATEIMMLPILPLSLECEWGLTPFEQSLSSASVFIGWLVASPIWGIVCDKYGRRKGLLLASITGFVFGILTVFSPSFYVFLALRVAVGFAVAGLAQSVTLATEFLPTSSRAQSLTVLKCFWAFGAALEAGIALVILPSLGWRWLVGFSALPLALFGVCCWWLPESVRFDIAQGRMIEARATLDRIAELNGVSLPEGELIHQRKEETVELDQKTLREKDLEKEEKQPECSEGLLHPKHRRTSIQLWTLWILSGFLYYGLTVYTPILLETSFQNSTAIQEETRVKRSTQSTCKLLSTETYVDIVVTTMSEAPGYILATYIIDRIGRRATLAVGYGVYAASWIALLFPVPRFVQVSILFVIRSAIANSSQTAYIYTSEVYPTSLRAQGLGMAGGLCRFGAMAAPVVTQVFASINLIFPPIIFTIVGIGAAACSILFPIETKGRLMK
ncbi:hypothetical protein PFISCL1PPCAC_14229, partial [Pristionchus fissidentatus]